MDSEDNAALWYFAYVSPSEDSWYVVVCPKGHKNHIVLQQQKFEVLFEIGASAIADGYYRDAVSSFTASLERFYEFFLQVIANAHQVSGPDFQQAWKRVSNQSERQLGAFIFTHLLVNHSVPILLPDKMVSFRNEVVHKGKIPTREAATEYGQKVLELIDDTFNGLRRNHSGSIDNILFQHVDSVSESLVKQIPDRSQHLTVHLSTIIDIITTKSEARESSLGQEVLRLEEKIARQSAK